jgi:Bardet-Biedl syndrome 2 protein
VVRAEDSRLLNDMELMRRAYTDLYSTNNQLVGNYNARANNHETLLAALKEVNVMIQRAAGLRVGRAKNTVITECRAAVKTNNMATIVQVIRYGNGVATAIK